MAKTQQEIKVALYGYGTVGEAVAKFLTSQTAVLSEKSGAKITLRYIIDRDPSTITLKKSHIICSDDHSLPLNDPDVHLIIELIGGVEAAYKLSKRAIEQKKHIVTANKALIAEHGRELCADAHANGTCIAFEASCGGAIPILRALYGGLISNRIDALYAIINGTCNYILTQMTETGMEYKEALAEAQRLGFAEADPSLDINGGDSAHKLAIMTTLAYGYRVSYKDIHTIGIEQVERTDIERGKGLGLQLKLIAMSIRQQDSVVAIVRPSFLGYEHPLRQVHGSYNAVSVYGNASGHTLFYGKGAGGSPTASAVIADIIGVSSGEIPTAFNHYSNWPDTSREIQLAPWTDLEHRYYIRLVVEDRPGMLSHITHTLGEEHLNIHTIHQDIEKNPSHSASHAIANVIITLHRAPEKRVLHAIKKLQAIAHGIYPIPILDARNDAV